MRANISGKLIGVTVGGTFISCEIESSLQYERTLLPSSSVTSGKDSEFIAGKGNWSINVSGNLLSRAVGADFKTLFTAWKNGGIIRVQFRTNAGLAGHLIYEGDAIVQSGNASAPIKGSANWNNVLHGTGPLSQSFQEFWSNVNSGL
ncbi:hypothetical protein ORI89_18810 [Sphingobacterium sp. UT-1RO-CII-1]|uniref:hypothetical protein n=1 Tax=Sphingobacterium sp. UT-1RO-CII-1 TaxID=2995225 RepID=UPI00227A318A|nr:hypothetical protein [Sphingobacterium sp. UT-1RO-CII-1]MCY4781709.1 hypothetical protein [Sphingobacterium sp. UT-1RO-CII-1]